MKVCKDVARRKYKKNRSIVPGLLPPPPPPSMSQDNASKDISDGGFGESEGNGDAISEVTEAAGLSTKYSYSTYFTCQISTLGFIQWHVLQFPGTTQEKQAKAVFADHILHTNFTTYSD